MNTVRSRWSEQVRQLLCSHFGATTWKMVYFLTTTAMCLVAFRNEQWWPHQLGGEGSEEQLWQGYPMQQNSVYCHLYFYLAFGHHLASLVCILKSPWLPDFFDQLLPCVAALCLIYFSYMSNFLRVGVVILFCHDICDIFTYGCKAFVDTPYHKVTIGLFMLLTTCWFYFRLYTFPAAALFPIFKAIKTRPHYSETEGGSYFIFILLTLCLMNIYWFVLMVKMFVHFIVSGQMRDLHSRVSDVDDPAHPRTRQTSTKPAKAD
ncbi:longevity-assurance domain-containing protein [Cyclospora cayetanensis]|uniref:Longevity-assurance domain-containing protein n=1 Tax=Cyclospora cayetanensis TaxID=88456 RepID=A0A1D3D2J1_9EIME|nr:longevity-assurance domain-containing protein [Cyclospora cayetanensis]